MYLRGQADKVGFELASIGWEESGAGNVRVNTNFTNKTPSVDLGFFMLNSISFLDRYYKEHPEKVRNHYLDNLLLDKIMTDDKFAQKYATKELKEWKSRGRNRKDMIKSYNCGTKIKRTKCEQYYNRVHQKMKILEKVYK